MREGSQASGKLSHGPASMALEAPGVGAVGPSQSSGGACSYFERMALIYNNLLL